MVRCKVGRNNLLGAAEEYIYFGMNYMSTIAWICLDEMQQLKTEISAWTAPKNITGIAAKTNDF